MVDYSAKSVNKELKPMLRAIGRSFPKSKEEMVAYLEEYDRNHPDKPAHLCDVPPTRARKTKAPNTPAPAPNVAAQPSSDVPRSSRKRKESPAVQPEPQAKRVKADKKAALSKSTENDQNEDTAMSNVNNDETPSLRTIEPSRNARLSPLEEKNEERLSQDGAQHDAELMASKDAPKAEDQTKELQIGLENVQTTQAMVGGASSTSNAKRTREQYSGGLDQQLAKLDTVVKAGGRRTQTKAQSASGKKLPVKDATDRGAVSKKERTGKKQAMGDQEPESKAPRKQKSRGKGKGKATASPSEDVEESVAGSYAKDYSDVDLTDTPAAEADESAPIAAPTSERALTKAEKLEQEHHELRELGGYSNPATASCWRQNRKTVLAPIDNYHHPKFKRAAEDLLVYRRQIERARENAERNNEPIPLQDCKSPPRKLDELRDYVHYLRC